MFIVYDEDELNGVVKEAFAVAPGKPVLLDKFLEEAIELDVDCISDGETTVVGGMLQHIEFAGVHSGDAAMVLPPHDLEQSMIEEVRQASHALAKALKVIGLMNIQFAIKDGELFLSRSTRGLPALCPLSARQSGFPLLRWVPGLWQEPSLRNSGLPKKLPLSTGQSRKRSFRSVNFPVLPSYLPQRCAARVKLWDRTRILESLLPRPRWPPSHPCLWKEPYLSA